MALETMDVKSVSSVLEDGEILEEIIVDSDTEDGLLCEDDDCQVVAEIEKPAKVTKARMTRNSRKGRTRLARRSSDVKPSVQSTNSSPVRRNQPLRQFNKSPSNKPIGLKKSTCGTPPEIQAQRYLWKFGGSPNTLQNGQGSCRRRRPLQSGNSSLIPRPLNEIFIFDGSRGLGPGVRDKGSTCKGRGLPTNGRIPLENSKLKNGDNEITLDEITVVNSDEDDGLASDNDDDCQVVAMIAKAVTPKKRVIKPSMPLKERLSLIRRLSGQSASKRRRPSDVKVKPGVQNTESKGSNVGGQSQRLRELMLVTSTTKQLKRLQKSRWGTPVPLQSQRYFSHHAGNPSPLRKGKRRNRHGNGLLPTPNFHQNEERTGKFRNRPLIAPNPHVPPPQVPPQVPALFNLNPQFPPYNNMVPQNAFFQGPQGLMVPLNGMPPTHGSVVQSNGMPPTHGPMVQNGMPPTNGPMVQSNGMPPTHGPMVQNGMPPTHGPMVQNGMPLTSGPMVPSNGMPSGHGPPNNGGSLVPAPVSHFPLIAPASFQIVRTLNDRLVTLPLGDPRPIVIDGSNVAIGHGLGKRFSCRGLEICIKKIKESLRFKEIVCFVPKFRQKKSQSVDTHILDRLEKDGILKFTPSREVNGQHVTSYDDRFILEYASSTGGIVISNDNYKDLFITEPQWQETIKFRILQFTWVNDILMFPTDPLGKHGPNLQQFCSFPVNQQPNLQAR